MIRAAIALPAALCASAAAATFHPVEDRAYRYDTVETRTADGVMRRFHASRSVVFHRSPAGYDATVTLDALDSQPTDDVGAMFLATTGALLHRPLCYRLDATGEILDVDEIDATIVLIADAVERGSRDRMRSGDLAQLASPLRTLPPERKRTMLLSILAPLIAGPGAERLPGKHAVVVPSRPPLAPGTALAGTESVSRSAAGVVTIAVRARGEVDAAAPRGTHGSEMTRSTSQPAATIETMRNIDAAAGLVVDSRSITEAVLADGETIHRTRIETIVTLRLASE